MTYEQWVDIGWELPFESSQKAKLHGGTLAEHVARWEKYWSSEDGMSFGGMRVAEAHIRLTAMVDGWNSVE